MLGGGLALMYFLIAVVFGLASATLVLNAIATLAVSRTHQLSRGQKIAQLAIVWCLPFVGSILVTRLLAESDPRVVYRRWIPSDTINTYVLQLLIAEARVSLRATQVAIEDSIGEAVSSHLKDAGGAPSTNGGEE